MWIRTVLVIFCIVVLNTITAYSLSAVENAREPTETSNGECCPCSPTSSGARGAQNEDAEIGDSCTVSEPTTLSDPPHVSGVSDSDGASSLLVPNTIRALHPTMRSFVDKNNRPLFSPKVGQVKSVLETLEETTDAEYQDAIAREPSRTTGKYAESSDDRASIFKETFEEVPPKALRMKNFGNVGYENSLLQDTWCFTPNEVFMADTMQHKQTEPISFVGSTELHQKKVSDPDNLKFISKAPVYNVFPKVRTFSSRKIMPLQNILRVNIINNETSDENANDQAVTVQENSDNNSKNSYSKSNMAKLNLIFPDTIYQKPISLAKYAEHEVPTLDMKKYNPLSISSQKLKSRNLHTLDANNNNVFNGNTLRNIQVPINSDTEEKHAVHNPASRMKNTNYKEPVSLHNTPSLSKSKQFPIDDINTLERTSEAKQILSKTIPDNRNDFQELSYETVKLEGTNQEVETKDKGSAETFTYDDSREKNRDDVNCLESFKQNVNMFHGVDTTPKEIQQTFNEVSNDSQMPDKDDIEGEVRTNDTLYFIKNDIAKALKSLKETTKLIIESTHNTQVEKKSSGQQDRKENLEPNAISLDDLQKKSDLLLSAGKKQEVESLKSESGHCQENLNFVDDRGNQMLHSLENISEDTFESAQTEDLFSENTKNVEKTDLNVSSGKVTNGMINPISEDVATSNEMNVEASDSIRRLSLFPLKSNQPTLSNFIQDIVVQPSLHINDRQFDLFKGSAIPNNLSPVNLSHFRTPMPTLDEIKSSIAESLNIIKKNDRSSEDDSDSYNYATKSPLSLALNDEKSNTNLPFTNRFEDLNLDLMQIKPLKFKQSDPQSPVLPALNLNAYKTKLSVPKILDIKPLKLESIQGNKGGLLGARLSIQNDKSKPDLNITPKSKYNSIFNDRLQPNVLRTPLTKLQRLNDLNTKLKDNLENNILSTPLAFSSSIAPISIKEPIGSHWKKVKNNFDINHPLKDSPNILSLAANTNNELNEKLQSLQYDLAKSLSSVHKNIVHSPKSKVTLDGSLTISKDNKPNTQSNVNKLQNIAVSRRQQMRNNYTPETNKLNPPAMPDSRINFSKFRARLNQPNYLEEKSVNTPEVLYEESRHIIPYNLGSLNKETGQHSKKNLQKTSLGVKTSNNLEGFKTTSRKPMSLTTTTDEPSFNLQSPSLTQIRDLNKPLVKTKLRAMTDSHISPSRIERLKLIPSLIPKLPSKSKHSSSNNMDSISDVPRLQPTIYEKSTAEKYTPENADEATASSSVFLPSSRSQILMDTIDMEHSLKENVKYNCKLVCKKD